MKKLSGLSGSAGLLRAPQRPVMVMAAPQTTSGGPRPSGSSRTGECTGRGAPTRTGGRPGSCSVAASFPSLHRPGRAQPRVGVIVGLQVAQCGGGGQGQRCVNLGGGQVEKEMGVSGAYVPRVSQMAFRLAVVLGPGTHGRRPAARSSRPRTWTRAQLVDGRHPSNTSPTRLIGAVSSAPTKVVSPSAGAPGGAAGAIWGASTDALMAASSAAHASASGSRSTGAGAAAAYRVPSNRRPRHAL